MTKHAQEAARFCEENPDIVQEFDEIAWRLIGRGADRYSADGIVHNIRLNRHLRGQPVKLNNNHVAFLARQWVEKHPHKRGFFELRDRKPRTFKQRVVAACRDLFA